MLMKLYARFDIDDLTDFDKLKPTDYPVMQDLYDLIEKEFMIFDHEKKASVHGGNLAEYLSWTALHVQGRGVKIF